MLVTIAITMSVIKNLSGSCVVVVILMGSCFFTLAWVLRGLVTGVTCILGGRGSGLQGACSCLLSSENNLHSLP